MPGETGYEALTLSLAKKWGADAIRDSDGTALSQEILGSGLAVYSTVCPIREHNAWIRQHPHCRQQTVLMSEPVIAEGERLVIPLLQGYRRDQFELNLSTGSLRRWQIYDRTAGVLLPNSQWTYQDGCVSIRQCIPYHTYTVNFFVYRVWEEISMYNHLTNNWGDREHLMQLDPRYPEAQDYLRGWMRTWCEQHPQTDIVRFTSLFYNFVWIWGENPRLSNRFTDWASYDYTVSIAALDAFEKAYGYEMTAEDFIHFGKRCPTHCSPSAKKRDWMDFTQIFVCSFAAELVAIVHEYGKKAYIFYDDSWVGMEPYGPYFKSIGFDGLIKCVFSGFEARLCAGVRSVATHELRLHPYLFPVGLGGAPTFAPGGRPERDAQDYWMHVRRALLRQTVDRLGLGGYVHLTQAYPAFVEAVSDILSQFRTICALHAAGSPWKSGIRIGILHAWGSLRTWTLSGHFHETHMHTLIHVLEALSGLPVDVSFLNFNEAKAGGLRGVDVILNAGSEGTAWSGGDAWDDVELVEAVTAWIHSGGIFLGIEAPAYRAGSMRNIRLAEILGVDLADASYACSGSWQPVICGDTDWIPAGTAIPAKANVILLHSDVRVLAAENGNVLLTERSFGRGKAVYLSGFRYSLENAAFLMQLLYRETGAAPIASCSHPAVECTVFPASRQLLAANNSDRTVQAKLSVDGKSMSVALQPYELRIIDPPCAVT